MKFGKTVQQLLLEAQRHNNERRDFVVTSAAMNMDTMAAQFRLSPDTGSPLAFGMTDLFHRQVGDKLGIPAKYYDRMRVDYPSLLAENVNSWLGRNEAKHMVRTLGGTARACLSDRYRRIDNWDLLQNIMPIIAEMPDARVESCEITENKLYLKVVNPRLETEVVPGDAVQAGIIISNSEVGLGAVSVMPLIYRLVCANGMIVSDYGKRKAHLGGRIEESWDLYSDETLQADDHALMLKLADIVRSAVDEARFATIVNTLRAAADVKITAPVASVVELTGKEYGFTKEENDGILQHLILGGDLSLYGLSNAVTRTANDVDSYDRATALEADGWKIATMEGKLWKELNAA
jgi:hypothetical protein